MNDVLMDVQKLITKQQGRIAELEAEIDELKEKSNAKDIEHYADKLSPKKNQVVKPKSESPFAFPKWKKVSARNKPRKRSDDE